MNVGDLIKYQDELYIVMGFEQSLPVARTDLEQVVLHHARTLKRRTIPMKWLRPHRREQ